MTDALLQAMADLADTAPRAAHDPKSLSAQGRRRARAKRSGVIVGAATVACAVGLGGLLLPEVADGDRRSPGDSFGDPSTGEEPDLSFGSAPPGTERVLIEVNGGTVVAAAQDAGPAHNRVTYFLAPADVLGKNYLAVAYDGQGREVARLQTP